MKLLYRYANTTLFLVVACFAVTLLQKGKTVKADYTGQCPDSIAHLTAGCPGGETSVEPTYLDRCASSTMVVSTSSGPHTVYVCCQYHGYNGYCTQPGQEPAQIGQIYTYYDQQSPYYRCAGEDTNECVYAFEFID